jgi:cell division protein FtsN
MSDHGLDDLVKDTDTIQSQPKRKSSLTILALVIIALILGTLLTNNLQEGEGDEEVFEENMSDFIAPELQLQNISNGQKSPLSLQEEDRFDSDLPSPDETTSTEAKELKQLIAQKKRTPLEEMQVIEMPIVNQRTATPEDSANRPVKEETTATIEQSQPQENTTPPTQEVAPKTEQKQQERAPKATPAPQPPKEEPIPQPEPPKPTPVPPSVDDATYYIQVGAFKSTPSSRLLSVIKSMGFSYTITPPNSDGTKKLLIGPYRNKPSATKALNTVQIRIKKDAYLIRK